MGLDMYVEKVKGKYNSEELLSEGLYEKLAENDELTSMGYFRKHSDLNAYITNLYLERGGEEEFNCIPFVLTEEDIRDILEKTLDSINGKSAFARGTGFFWGQTLIEDHKEAAKIFTDILEKTDFETETIVYHCWY